MIFPFLLGFPVFASNIFHHCCQPSVYFWVGTACHLSKHPLVLTSPKENRRFAYSSVYMEMDKDRAISKVTFHLIGEWIVEILISGPRTAANTGFLSVDNKSD